MSHRKKKTTLQEEKVALVLRMISVVPRHYKEIQDNLELSKEELDAILLYLEGRGLINPLYIDHHEVPDDVIDSVRRSYPRKERKRESFLNRLEIDGSDYPDGSIAFYYVTHRGLRFLDERRTILVDHWR